MPHPCENYIHLILNDNKYARKVIEEDLKDFWFSAADFLETTAIAKQEGFLKKMKYFNIENYVNALNKIIAEGSIQKYDKSILVKINKIFIILLNPKSPDKYKETIIHMLLDIVKSITPSDNISLLNGALNAIVPWSKFARDNEIEGFKKIQSAVYVSVPPEKEWFQDKPIVYLQQLLDFLATYWKIVPNTCCKILFENILSIIYMDLAMKAHVPCSPYGFKEPTPLELHECTFSFLNRLVDISADISYFALAPILSDFMQIIFTCPYTMVNDISILIALKFSEHMIRCKKISDLLLSTFPNIFYNFLNVSKYALNNTADQDVIRCLNAFDESFINVLMEHFSIPEGFDKIDDLIDQYSGNLIAQSLFLSAVSYILTTQEESEKAISFVKRNICKSRLFAAACMKYSMYIAVLCLPYLLDIDYETAIEASKKHVLKKTRTKQVLQADLFACNCEDIFKAPEKVHVPNTLTLFDDMMPEVEKLQMPIVRIPRNTTPISQGQYYLSILQAYASETDANYKKRLFAGYIAFHSTIYLFKNLPLGVKAKNDQLFYFGAEKYLLEDGYQEKDGFNLLQNIFSSIKSREVTTKEMQIKWQNCIIQNLSNPNAISSCVTCIINSQYNSLNLVDEVLNTISQHNDIRMQHMDFIRLYPLFNASQKEKALDLFEKWINEMKNPDLIAPVCIYFIHMIPEKREIMMNNLLQCCKRHSIQSLYSVMSSIDFITLDNCKTIIQMTMQYAKKENLEESAMLIVISTLSIIHTKYQEYQEFQEFLLRFLKEIDYQPPELANQIEICISYILILSHPKQDLYRYANLSNNHKITDYSRIFVTDPNTIIHISTQNDRNSVQLETETLGGHYHFNFQKIDTPQKSEDLNFSFEKIFEYKENCDAQHAFSSKILAAFKTKDEVEVINEKEAPKSDANYPIEPQNPKCYQTHFNPQITKLPTNASVLTALGFSNPENLQIQSIKSQSQISLHIPKLQQLTTRYQIKCAVIYTSNTVSTQEEILRCTLPSTPPHFREFIQNLGDCVDMEHHYGYDGALEHSPNMNSIYYCDENFEIMFHVGPIMKTHKDDPQQVYKKRHIGNDYITIVWCENSDYNMQTISSQFNFVHIIIYTLPSGYFCVQTLKKENFGSFGPLSHIAVCKKESLAPLIRSTVKEAQLVINFKQVSNSFPTHLRKQTISHVIKEQNRESDTLRNIYF